MSEHETLKHAVRELLNDLPSKRDWLDPDLEKTLRYLVNAETPASNHRALMATWEGQKGIL